ncbi:MAG: DUF2031 domain-containing protein [Nanoarchaeota archaeon]|nr:DUF2031 domain-containing protein [Nanoarchaeota archaeon]
MEYESYELLAKLANQYKLDINKDEDVEKILTLFKSRVEELGKSPTFVYGKRLENAFFEMVKALDSVKFIKEEDTQKVYSELDFKIPDYKIVSKDEEIFLVEVKNFTSVASTKNINKHTEYTLTQKYWNQLKIYSELFSIPVKIVIFWRNWELWTLNDLDEFKSVGVKRKIKLFEAFSYSKMYKLGDKLIGTKSPLVFRLIMEPKPLDIDKPSMKVVSKIIDVQMCSEENVIRDKEISRFAYLLFWFGKWKQEGPFPVIKDNTFHGMEYIAKPIEETSRQGFEMIATLSMMYMNMYHLLTYREVGLPNIYPKGELPTIAKIIPENPFDRGLPLWIFTMVPSFQ